ncbi:hypothetical protein BD626DRAFT_503947 [Schizophyllum amplum]|uniref:Uncharacterized protein n=1 Tax=Schizophyllum amplum TaxID=97359 RepID=A0A550C7N7_9AGAR|nr:hypothetical protein BD626DRAFT_503947 [Auriculariopsis ampla]
MVLPLNTSLLKDASILANCDYQRQGIVPSAGDVVAIAQSTVEMESEISRLHEEFFRMRDIYIQRFDVCRTTFCRRFS